jgi:hypothetical protein
MSSSDLKNQPGRSITESIREANPEVNYLEATATGILHKVCIPQSGPRVWCQSSGASLIRGS